MKHSAYACILSDKVCKSRPKVIFPFKLTNLVHYAACNLTLARHQSSFNSECNNLKSLNSPKIEFIDLAPNFRRVENHKFLFKRQIIWLNSCKIFKLYPSGKEARTTLSILDRLHLNFDSFLFWRNIVFDKMIDS